LVEAARLDDSVKAVVLRVNSPGGSVLASDKIRAAVDLLGKEKTVIASYGDYAASGGYWISSGCQEIYTDAMTLTGSIGVFSMIPDFSKTAKDLVHVGVESVGSHRHSDIMSLMRPLDKEEIAAMQGQVEAIYGRFVELVARGRNLSPDFVDSIGQGRVWTGSKARELGLADQIGTLQDALFRAAVLSGGPEDYMSWQVVQYPAQPDMTEMLLSMLQQMPERPTVLLENTPFAGLSEAFDALDVKAPFKVWAGMPYEIEVK
ncbi:MAG: signal peptide peptidase SppA, partial [Bacteroidota bacterium]|nr:signal peptide peptidase SppA [Bacteroidota bacterium]